VGRRTLSLIGAAALLFGVAARGEDWSPPPTPREWVTDETAFLSPGVRDSLNARLRAFQEATGHHVLVYVTQSLKGLAPEDYSVKAFAAWKVGRKDIDDGLVLFVFRDERKIRIEVGYGLEGTVPDVIASRIIREAIAPVLQKGDADAGITAGVDALLRTIGGETGGEAYAPVAPRHLRETQIPIPRPLLYLIGFLVLVFLITHPSFALQLLWIASSMQSGGGGWGGSDGGGYSGGGGRSGGGGATGSW
jgi:uncharacterized protein